MMRLRLSTAYMREAIFMLDDKHVSGQTLTRGQREQHLERCLRAHCAVLAVLARELFVLAHPMHGSA
jgi:hypothetical protein